MFQVILIIFCLCCAGIAVLFFAVAGRPGMKARLEKVPRYKWAGLALSAWMLIVCIPHVEQLLMPDSFLVQNHLISIGAAVGFVLIWLYADYIFARSFAAVCIYCAYLLLREGFNADPALYPAMAVCFFALGILGILIAAKPVWMRDWLRAACDTAWVRCAWGSAFALAAVIALAGLCF